jgi:hypothetical protein
MPVRGADLRLAAVVNSTNEEAKSCVQ